MTFYERVRDNLRKCYCCRHRPDLPDDFLFGSERSRDANQTVATCFRKSLVKKNIDGTGTAVECLNRRLTFDEIELFSSVLGRDLVDRLGDDFKNSNPDGDRVIGLMVAASEKLVICILAIWKAGYTYLPLDGNQTESVVWSVVNAFRPVAIIADANSSIWCKFHGDWELDFKLMCFEDIWFQMSTPYTTIKRGHQTPFELINVKAVRSKGDSPVSQRVAAIFHMFGLGNAESNPPRGVRISHQAILNSVFWFMEQFPFKWPSIASLSLPMADFNSLLQIFGPLLNGTSIVVLVTRELQKAEFIVSSLTDNGITHVTLYLKEVQLLVLELQKWEETGRDVDPLGSLMYVFCTEVVDSDTATRFVSHMKKKTLVCLLTRPEFSGATLFESLATQKDVDFASHNGRIAYGSCVHNVKFFVLDETWKRPYSGKMGKVYISGPQVPVGFVANQCDGLFSRVKHFFDGYQDTHPTPGMEVELLETSEFGYSVRGHDGKYRYHPITSRGEPVENLVHRARFIKHKDPSQTGFQGFWKVVSQ